MERIRDVFNDFTTSKQKELHSLKISIVQPLLAAIYN